MHRKSTPTVGKTIVFNCCWIFKFSSRRSWRCLRVSLVWPPRSLRIFSLSTSWTKPASDKTDGRMQPYPVEKWVCSRYITVILFSRFWIYRGIQVRAAFCDVYLLLTCQPLFSICKQTNPAVLVQVAEFLCFFDDIFVLKNFDRYITKFYLHFEWFSILALLLYFLLFILT